MPTAPLRLAGIAALLTIWISTPDGQEAAAFRVTAVSTRADMVTGGDVLVSIVRPVPPRSGSLRITLNSDPTTAAETRDGPNGKVTALVKGLRLGANEIVVSDGIDDARLWVVNHPVHGPVFSGPHEQPFFCETHKFALRSGGTLGNAVDEHCSVPTRVDYVYRSTAGGPLKAWPSNERPADLATTTVSGSAVPYIVRIETGTINRAIYQTSVLHDPAGQASSVGRRLPGWNGRLIYTFGGGCSNGWYRQASTTGGVEEDLMLRQGYAVASASLNVFGNNCNDLLAAETMMMVKERFIEAYGAPGFTIGWGCSGGSYQVLQIADNYPGLLDGIIPGCTFPDVGFGTVPTITDARLLNRYFSAGRGLPFSDEQKRAVTGFAKLATMTTVTAQAGRIATSEFCPDVLPLAMRYHPVTNPRGARCGVFDHTVNVYGREPVTGHARRPLDNVGIQYGLKAFNDGVISAAQFLDVNERIGGYDGNGAMVATRTEGDVEAIRAAYRTGRLTSGSGGLKSTPVIEYRGYADDAPKGDLHLRFYSFMMRERLKKANGGRADHYVMLVEDSRRGLYSVQSPVLQQALTQMDTWLSAIGADTSTAGAATRMLRAKPADLVDACWTRDPQPQRIVEPLTHGSGRCNTLYPSASFPREVAGASIAGDVVKCEVRPVSATDYKTPLSASDLARLRRVFPQGVCDWSKPGVGQAPLVGTWLSFGGS